MSLTINRLEINDTLTPYFSDYVFVEEIEYLTAPKRSMTGKIVSWPSYYYIPTFTVTWNYLTNSEFQSLMSLIRTPDFKVKYFDTNSGTYKTGMFYVPPQSYNAMVAKDATLTGYEGVILKFICTNNEV